MDRKKYESNLKIYEKLIDYAQSILKECGWDENASNTYTYIKREPTAEEFDLFSHQAKSLIGETFGMDSHFYRYVINNISMNTTNIFGHIYKKNLIPAYKTFKKMSIFQFDEKNGNTIYTKRINSIDLFKDLRWEEITLKFLDGFTVSIHSDNRKYKTDYKEMGFEDRRKFKPNKQWLFLQLLATKQGKVAWSDMEADPSFRKIKQRLSNCLKEYFQIEEDPFYEYKPIKEYRIKINLLPE